MEIWSVDALINHKPNMHQYVFPPRIEYLSSDSDSPKFDKKKSKTERKSKAIERETDEKERVKKRIGGFNWKTSYVWKTLTSYFGGKVSHEELTSIAEILAVQSRVKLDRDARRRKAVLIKWYEENWGKISHFLQFIVLDASEKQNRGARNYLTIE